DQPGAEIANVKIGQIQSIDPHPDADKLVVCKTDVGEGDPLQIVCGARNMKPGDKVPTAVVGATLPGGFKITGRKMRGVASQGMMCSATELAMGEDHSGLLILPEDAPVGADAVEYLGLDDTIFEIEVTPNRGDWASMIGVARELAALLGLSMTIPAIACQEDAKPASELSSVTIEDPELCPRYIGRVLTDVTIGPSPLWLCQRLIAGGVRPINNVVDITNYVLLETGHPLHAFDYDKLGENRIVVRTARDGETIKTIDEEVRKLSPDMLIIADATEPVAVAGIMGGNDSEVGETTTRVFLESAYFDPRSVRKTARTLGMITEASQRFQRGADPIMAEYAEDRAVALMQELAGATLAAGLLDEHPNPLPIRETSVAFARTHSLLGAEVSADQQCAILEGLGFEILKRDDASCSVRIPSWRHDVSMDADLIEEIARHYGYDNIPVALPRARAQETVYAPHEKPTQALRKQLVAMGLTEVMPMTFSSQGDVEKAGLGGECLTMVALQNPMSELQATMRTSLVPGLLSIVSNNFRHGVNSIQAFEIGPVYRPIPAAELPEQKSRLALVLSGRAETSHWSREERDFDLYDLKGLA
ncbi:MAG: phenylalanine--tRNA ligase subunit beta, partial [bacterium]|nr:phenylalanine--tRNA ligase subunit beta [bacterium]